MQEHEYVALVERIETYSRENPRAYKVRVALLALLGYAFLVGLLIGVLLIVAAVIYGGTLNFFVIKLLIIPIGLGAVVLRSLWIEFPAPEGVELQSSHAPKLFELVEKIRSATRGPRVHKVLLTGDFNAAIVQRPRLGMLGWQQNYLIVGVPLMQALSPSDVRAVLMHEFGHLSGNHGRFSGWIYGARQTWIQVLSNMQQQRRVGTGLLERFFNWYAPYFEAYSFVLARAQEYEADRCSAKLVGTQASARALINFSIKNKALEDEFLPSLFKRADREPSPPDDAFTEMIKWVRNPVAEEKSQLWFSQLLTERHHYNDTHPALADRLIALGYPRVREQVDLTDFRVEESAESGLEHFVRTIPKGLFEGRNRSWRERVREAWVDRYHFVREAQRSLVKLNEKAETETLTLDETWDRARFVAGTETYAAAIPYLREVLELIEDHVLANYMLGEALLGEGDESGIEHIKVSMAKDHTSIPSGCQLIYFFLTSRERKEEALKYLQRLNDYYAKVELAQQERVTISKTDDFSSHGLNREELAKVQSQLASYPLLASAYLVKKVVKHFPEEPSFVLGVKAKKPWYSSSSQNDQRDQELVNQLAQNVVFPAFTFIIVLEKNYKPLRKIFPRIDHSEIYRVR